jgi:hypothetical protein
MAGRAGPMRAATPTASDDAKARFRTVWAGVRAGLTDNDIAKAHRYAEASAEALARYDRKGS